MGNSLYQLVGQNLQVDFRFIFFCLLGVSAEYVPTQGMQVNELRSLKSFSFKKWLNKCLYHIDIATVTNHHTKALKETN